MFFRFYTFEMCVYIYTHTHTQVYMCACALFISCVCYSKVSDPENLIIIVMIKTYCSLALYHHTLSHFSELLVFWTMDKVQKPVILSVMCHPQNPLV
jgi:hypothetical protein